jgi:glutathione synthase/RimK-type ligase-like ATP-grasp enzyme
VAAPTVMIVGDEGDAHAAAVARALARRGAAAAFLDFRRFPGAHTLAWEPVGRRGAVRAGAATIAVDALRSTYWRTASATRAPAGLLDALHAFAEQESRRALESLLRGLACPVINSPEAVAAHRYKPVQSATVAALGVAVPETLISNDPAAVAAFVGRQAEGAIVKPVGGGAYARRVGPGDLDRHASIRACPMQYQAYVPGEDLRVYVVGERVFAGRIVTADPRRVDFRTDPSHVSVATTLADEEAATCRRIAAALGLVLAGIDLRRTPAGTPVFLEANPSPMFLRFERDTGHPILAALVDRLLAP